MKITAIYVPYAGYSFEDEKGEKIKNIENLWLIDLNGVRGKIKCTGTEYYQEHGLSGSEDKYSFINENIEFRRVENKDEFITEDTLEYYEKENKTYSTESCLKIHGFNGTFTYDPK